jgi:hypothetical protein
VERLRAQRAIRLRHATTTLATTLVNGETPAASRDALKTAGEAVAILAGIVALLYVLGGAVLMLRLLSDNFGLDAVVNLIGQLPREFVIAAGFVEAVAPALLVGVVATMGFAARDGPRRREGSDALNEGPRWLLILLALAAVALVLIAPALTLAVVRSQEWELYAAVVAIPVTYLLVLPGWWVIRQIGKTSWLRFPRAVAGGAIWAGIALVPAVVFAGGVEFERAQICVSERSTPVQGFLIADTKDRVLLGSNAGDVETVSSFPTRVVRQLQYGDLTGSLDCG